VTEYQAITFATSGAVARIPPNRPGAANGMDHTMTRELADAVRRCDAADVKAVVLTGAWSPRRCRTANATSAPRRLADGSRHLHGAVTLLSASSNNGPDEQLELEAG
jgi:1,4-dihydroxy-2-naphthoyl-CoA synthase